MRIQATLDYYLVTQRTNFAVARTPSSHGRGDGRRTAISTLSTLEQMMKPRTRLYQNMSTRLSQKPRRQNFGYVLLLVSLVYHVLLSCLWVYRSSNAPHNSGPVEFGEAEHAGQRAGVAIDLLVKNAATQAAERDAWFKAAKAHHVRHRDENGKLARLDLSSFYGGIMLQPSSVCPADLVKTTSVVEIFDGGKWLCGASRLRAIADSGPACVVYSLGCNFETSFEQTIQRLAGGGCDIHLYDPTLKPLRKVKKFAEEIIIEKMYLHEIAATGMAGHSNITIDGKTFEAQDLETMFNNNGHSCIDILKFDIEGAEYSILEHTDWCE